MEGRVKLNHVVWCYKCVVNINRTLKLDVALPLH